MAEINNPHSFSHLSSLSSIDGRFRGKLEDVSLYFSEAAIYKQRVFVEIQWLLHLSKVKIIRKFSISERKFLQDMVKNFSEKDAQKIWDTDMQINHDTKSIEIFIADKLKKTTLSNCINFIHFGLTSTDVDNLAFMLSLRDFFKNIFYPQCNLFLKNLAQLAGLHKKTSMLARTHGVPALPTTAGKELIVYAVDFKNQLEFLQHLSLTAKVSGAVGNRNELHAAYPKFNWENITNNFIRSFEFTPQTYTTQVESHTDQANIFSAISQLSRIGKKLAQDLWLYNSLGCLAWRDSKGHVGSSVMPHKINPIGAELANTYFATASDTLESVTRIIMENRLQRDLRDKYALRKVNEAMAECVLALRALTEALTQIGFNEEKLKAELLSHWEILSAPVQTILRAEKVKNPYQLLKDASRGLVWDESIYTSLVASLPVSVSVKKRLNQLSPATYTGEAVALTEKGIREIQKYLLSK